MFESLRVIQNLVISKALYHMLQEQYEASIPAELLKKISNNLH